ncbi:MAG: excinuclease ABC subunit B [Spirochaetia bacterium]|nr:excinuclease ABC subunit B [Spirochaetia bacterium]MCF7946570.1 excinuclease ABC subunit B [Spirochaetia bacterium]MCF7952914.1 excinuclease ABC subunit B [Spirochaetales bacterium]
MNKKSSTNTSKNNPENRENQENPENQENQENSQAQSPTPLKGSPPEVTRFAVSSEYEPAGDQGDAIEALSKGILEYGYDIQTLKGVTGSGKTYTMAKIIEQVQQPTLVLSHNKTLAAQLYREFTSYFPNNAVEYFVSYYDYYQPEAYVPSRDLYIEKDASINDEIDRMRLSATSSLLQRNDVIVVSTVSCIYGLGSPAAFHNMRMSFEVGKSVNHTEFIQNLIRMQYERNDIQLERGSFRIRGDVLEIYPAYLKEAYRIVFSWDEIESISRIHPITGEVTASMSYWTLYPAKHFVLPEEQIKMAIADIQKELEEQYTYFMEKGKIVEAERIKTRTEYDLEMLQEMGYCSGIENYSRPLSGRAPGERPAVLLDYFPDEYLTFIDESHVTLPQVRGMYEGDRSRKQNLVEYGFRLPSALDNRPLILAEFEEIVDKRIYVSATPGPKEHEQSKAVVEQIIRPTGLLDPEIDIRPTTGQIEDLYSEIQKRTVNNERILVTTLTKKMSEDLTDYLAGIGVKVRYLHSEIETIERVELLRDLRNGDFDVLIGINLLREGLDLPEVSLVAILDADKVGFLRSATSLIQTIGRAARNVNGKVIMYADAYSDAMKQAVQETNRRRKIQKAYNDTHNITPKSIHKAIQNILERKVKEERETEETNIEVLKGGYNILEKSEREKYIKQLEKLMLEYAKDMEYEKAAAVRDEIENIKKMQLS